MTKPKADMKLKILPLTPDLWPALEDLFGKKGACNGCWCMYWRIGSKYNKRDRAKNKAAFRAIVKNGPPAGPPRLRRRNRRRLVPNHPARRAAMARPPPEPETRRRRAC